MVLGICNGSRSRLLLGPHWEKVLMVELMPLSFLKTKTVSRLCQCPASLSRESCRKETSVQGSVMQLCTKASHLVSI